MNRVWIKNGNIHIIPIDEPGKSKDGGMKLESALSYLDSKIIKNPINKKFNQIISKRISTYPSFINANFHNTLCILPKYVGMLLLQQPQLLATCIHYLNNKQNKHEKNYILQMSKFYHNDLITIPIQFTKILYAKNLFLSFHPPSKFHSHIKNINKLCVNTHPTVSKQISKAFDIGCRLACGLEIAYQTSKYNHDMNNPSTVNPNISIPSTSNSSTHSSTLPATDIQNKINKLKQIPNFLSTLDTHNNDIHIHKTPSIEKQINDNKTNNDIQIPKHTSNTTSNNHMNPINNHTTTTYNNKY